jgi:hypothetical protein
MLKLEEDKTLVVPQPHGVTAHTLWVTLRIILWQLRVVWGLLFTLVG